MIVELTTISDVNGNTLTISGEHNGIPVRQVDEGGEMVDVFEFYLLHFVNNTNAPWTLRVSDQRGPRVDIRVNAKTESHRGLAEIDPEAKRFESYNVSFNVSKPLL